VSILLLTATAMEGDRLAAAFEEAIEQTIAGRRWLSGALHGADTLLVEGGLGAVNTAHALTRALELSQPDLVLQIGVGGAYDASGLAIGDIALSKNDSFADLGVMTPSGWQGAEAIGIPVLSREVDYYNTYPCDAPRTQHAHTLLSSHLQVGVSVGPFATVQEVSGTAALGEERRRRIPGAICESMEGAAAAQLCALYQVDFLQLRAISNAVEDRDRSRWNLPLACERAQSAAMLLLAEWGQKGDQK
jgi:futalosine hydrolase